MMTQSVFEVLKYLCTICSGTFLCLWAYVNRVVAYLKVPLLFFIEQLSS
jgi:hypothetical protein